MTATAMQPKKVFSEDELSILFARITDRTKDDWNFQRSQVKDGQPVRNSTYSLDALRLEVNKHHPGAFIDKYRFQHYRNAGKGLERRGDTAKPKISQLEMETLLDFFFAGPLDKKYWPNVVAFMEEGEGAKYLGLASGADMPEHERHLMRAFQALNNQYFESQEKVNNLERKFRLSTATSTAQEVEIEQLKAELDKRARELQELAQKLRDNLARLESTTKEDEQKQVIAALRDEFNRIL